MKLLKLVDTWELYRDDRESLDESNECVVRALASFLDKPYNRVINWCRDAMDRKHRRGVFTIEEMAKLLVYDNPVVRDLTAMSSNGYYQARYNASIDKHGEDILCKEKIRHLKAGVVDILPPENKILTFGKFVREVADPNKSYFVLVRGHALAVVNGVVYDNSIRTRSVVMFAWEK